MLDRLHGLTDGALIINSRGVDLGARAAARPRLPVRRPRSADAAERADSLRLRGQHIGRRPGDATPAPARPPADRADHRTASAGSRPRAAAEATALRWHRPGSSRIPHSRSTSIPEFEPGRKAAEQLLDLADRPTAIFAFNDNIAIGAIQAARARGLRVPEDLSVVGFDDVEYATIVTPALTTVRQPLAEMGRTAVSLLSRLLEGQRVRDAARRARDAPRRTRLHRSAAKSGRVVIP